MSGFEGREKEIADAIRAKLRERGIGSSEIREIAALHKVHHRIEEGGTGGGGQRCREQYCDPFSDDPILGPVTGSPEAGDIPKDFKEKHGGKELSSLRSCSEQSIIDCVYNGTFCAYECVHNSVFAPVAYMCMVPHPGDPFHCQEDFDCEVDFTCEPDVSFICDDGFTCSGLYYLHDYECESSFKCNEPNGARFMCSKSIDHQGFVCGTVSQASFYCTEHEWFSCLSQHNCSIIVVCNPVFHCEEYICGSIHTCPDPGFDCKSF